MPVGGLPLALEGRGLDPNRKLFARSVAMGALISMSAVFEHVFGLACVALAGLIVVTLSLKRSLPGLLAGGILPVAGVAAYYYSLSGEFSLPYAFESTARFREGMSAGFMGITRPKLSVLYYITVHPYRGLFFFSPVLLLFFVGTPLVLRLRRPLRVDLLCAYLVLVAYLLFNSSYYMWWGGWSLGPRHLIPALAFLFLPIAVVMGQSGRWRVAVFTLGMVAVALHLPAILTNPHVPSLHSDAVLMAPSIFDNLESPRLTQTLPNFAQGEIATVLPWRQSGAFLPLMPLLMMWAGVFALARHWAPRQPVVSP
jgi:hypothetical protein